MKNLFPVPHTVLAYAGGPNNLCGAGCYSAKFGCSRSNHMGVRRGSPIFWERWDPPLS